MILEIKKHAKYYADRRTVSFAKEIYPKPIGQTRMRVDDRELSFMNYEKGSFEQLTEKWKVAMCFDCIFFLKIDA